MEGAERSVPAALKRAAPLSFPAERERRHQIGVILGEHRAQARCEGVCSNSVQTTQVGAAIDALAANKAQDEKTAPSPGTVASPPVLTGYSLYPR